jgi:hypothetical protein
MHVPTTTIEVARTQFGMKLFLEAKVTLRAMARRAPAPEGDDEEPVQFVRARAAAKDLESKIDQRIARVHLELVGVTAGTTPTILIDGGPAGAPVAGDLPVNPGQHTIVAKTPAIEARQTIDIAEGEAKDVLLDVTPPSAHPTEDLGEARPRDRTMVYVLSGLAGAALAGAATTEYLGQSSLSRLRNTCAPRCTEAQVSDARTLLTVADVAAATGIAAGAGALAWWFFDSPRRPSEPAPASAPRVTLSVHPRRGGALAVVNGTF